MASAIDADAMVLWLNGRSQAAADFAKQYLLAHDGVGSDIAGDAKPDTASGVSQVFAGDAAAAFFGASPLEERRPGVVQHGVVYTGKKRKIAEHGGADPQDRHVPLVLAAPGVEPSTVDAAVETTQIAPTILGLLGLDPGALAAVRARHTPALALDDRDEGGDRAAATRVPSTAPRRVEARLAGVLGAAMRTARRLALAATALAAATLPHAGLAGAAQPKMKIDPRLRVDTVCLPVTDPAGLPRTLYGKRYTTPGATSSTPAIVLVHGIASSTANWDFTPTWSTARALATAGYVVYSYDRLGYARSSYFDVPGGGATLTTREHRRMLHEVVQDVKSGGYATSATDDCAAATPGGMRNPTVAIIGHSAGGWIVAGYPGTYHDVAAMIQTSIFATTDGAAASSSQSSPGGGFEPNPEHPDYFDFFHQRSDCESFNVHPPGAVPSVVDIACTPPFIPSPFGEIADLAAKARRERRGDRADRPGDARAAGRRGPRHDRAAGEGERGLRVLPRALRLRRLALHDPELGPPVPGARLAAAGGRRVRAVAQLARGLPPR